MDISILFNSYQVLLSVAIFALGIRLLSRRALVLEPLKIYLWLVTPYIFIILIGAFSLSGSFFIFILLMFLFILFLCVTGFFLLRQFMNGPLVFNCEKMRLIELLSQILQEQGVPFSQERAVFSIHHGQSTLELSGYGKYASFISIKGNTSFFQPVLKKLQIALKDEQITTNSILVSPLIFLSIFALGQAVNFAFSDVLEIDLYGYGEIIRQIGEFGNLGFYAFGSIFALGLVVYSIQLLIPKPQIMKTSTWRWGGLLLFVWLLVESVSFANSYTFNLVFLFQVMAFGGMMFFGAKEMPIFCAVSNLGVAVNAMNILKEILDLQQLEFQELGNEFHLKSGIVIEVYNPMKQNAVAIVVIGRNPESKLFIVEQLFANSLQNFPGKADVGRGLALLVPGLMMFAYFGLGTLSFFQNFF